MSPTSLTEIRNRVELLSRKMERPIHLQRWSPGDGFTRYRLMLDDGSDLQPFGAKNYRRHELVAFLDGALMVYDRQWSDRNA